jgi:hypothetical protein
MAGRSCGGGAHKDGIRSEIFCMAHGVIRAGFVAGLRSDRGCAIGYGGRCSPFDAHLDMGC